MSHATIFPPYIWDTPTKTRNSDELVLIWWTTTQISFTLMQIHLCFSNIHIMCLNYPIIMDTVLEAAWPTTFHIITIYAHYISYLPAIDTLMHSVIQYFPLLYSLSFRIPSICIFSRAQLVSRTRQTSMFYTSVITLQYISFHHTHSR